MSTHVSSRDARLKTSTALKRIGYNISPPRAEKRARGSGRRAYMFLGAAIVSALFVIGVALTKLA